MIVLVAMSREGANAPFVGMNYLRALREEGLTPVSLFDCGAEEAARLAQRFDGLVLIGGGDVAPALYGAQAHPRTSGVDEVRDKAEIALLSAFRSAAKPVLGVCRGIQLINVALGGTLWQDLEAERGLPHPNGMMHDVSVAPGSALFEEIGVGRITVNSYHHQAIRDLAPGLRAVAREESGLIEAIEAEEGAFLLGVQWHPEMCRDYVLHARQVFSLFSSKVAKK